MRRLTAILLALILCLSAALGEDDGDCFRGVVGGKALELGANMLHTVTDDGCVRLNFFAYDGGICTDVFIALPRDVQPGEVLTQDSPAALAHPGCGLIVVIDGENDEITYSSALPGARWTISVETAESRGGMLAFSGTVEAALPLESGPAGAEPRVTVAGGRFTIHISEDFSGDAEEEPDSPDIPFVPMPTPTLRPGEVRV